MTRGAGARRAGLRRVPRTPLAGVLRLAGAAAAPFQGILDQLATPAVGAWSVARVLRTAWLEQPLVRLRRDSNNAESDFGADGEVNLDTSATVAWIGGSSGLGAVVYDQVGLADLVQATDAAQPAFNPSLLNGRAGLVCAKAADGMSGTLASAPSGAQAHCIVAVGRVAADYAGNAVAGLVGVGDGSSSSGLAVSTIGGLTGWWWGGAFALNNANVGGTHDSDLHIFVKRYNGGAGRLWVDGAEIAPLSGSGAAALNFDNGKVSFNSYDGTNGRRTPSLLELIWFPTDITDDDLTRLHADLAAFYGV